MGLLIAWVMAAQAVALVAATVAVAPLILPPAKGVTSLSSPNWGKRDG